MRYRGENEIVGARSTGTGTRQNTAPRAQMMSPRPTLAIVRATPTPGMLRQQPAMKVAIVRQGAPLKAAPLQGRMTSQKLASLAGQTKKNVIAALLTPTPPGPGQGTRLVTINPPRRGGGIGQTNVRPGQPPRRPITIRVRTRGTAGAAPKLTPGAVRQGALAKGRPTLRLGQSSPSPVALSPRLGGNFISGSDPNVDWNTWMTAWGAVGALARKADRGGFAAEYGAFNEAYPDPDENGDPRDPDAWSQYVGQLIAFNEAVRNFFERMGNGDIAMLDVHPTGPLGGGPGYVVPHPSTLAAPYGRNASGTPLDRTGQPAPYGLDAYGNAIQPGYQPQQQQPDYGAQQPDYGPGGSGPGGGQGGGGNAPDYGQPGGGAPPSDYAPQSYGPSPMLAPYDGGGGYAPPFPGYGPPQPQYAQQYAQPQYGQPYEQPPYGYKKPDYKPALLGPKYEDDDKDDEDDKLREKTYGVTPEDKGPSAKVVDKDILSDLFASDSKG